MIDTFWTKSSYSQGGASNCLEARWTKSSFSEGRNPNCIECRTDHGQVLVRDTKHRHLGHLQVPTTEWHAFLVGLRRGELS